MTLKEALRELSWKRLNKEDREEFEELLEEGDVVCAQFFLLNAVDSLLSREKITATEAREDYRIINLPEEAIAHARMKRAHQW